MAAHSCGQQTQSAQAAAEHRGRMGEAMWIGCSRRGGPNRHLGADRGDEHVGQRERAALAGPQPGELPEGAPRVVDQHAARQGAVVLPVRAECRRARIRLRALAHHGAVQVAHLRLHAPCSASGGCIPGFSKRDGDAVCRGRSDDGCTKPAGVSHMQTLPELQGRSSMAVVPHEVKERRPMCVELGRI